MARRDLQPDFDESLLSAYLDDELTPAERAQVETRLAADPAARQRLDDLRDASAAMRRLPAEAVGDDLRPDILRRAERAVLTGLPLEADQHARHLDRSSADDSRRPTITIGRTRRAWVWAGLAVAAALLLTVYLPDDQPNGHHLPPLAAQRDRDPPRELQLRALEEPPDVAAAPAEAPHEPPPTDPIATSDVPVGELADGQRFEHVPLARGDVSAPVDDEDVLVVHVNARPQAYRTRAFDRLLVGSDIAIEPAAGLPAIAALPRSPNDHDEVLAPMRTDDAAVEADVDVPDVETVLVEAPPAQIEQFLNILCNDVSNFAAVVIDDEATRDEAPAKQQAIQRNWQQFNRGSVPTEQKQQFASSVERSQWRSRGPAVQLHALDKNDDDARGGREQRVELFSRGRLHDDQPRGDRDPARRRAADDDKLQVLFVVTPEPAAPTSPQADDPPE